MCPKKPSIMNEGESISQKVWQWSVSQTDNRQEYYQECSGSLRKTNQVMYGRHYKIIGKCIRRNIMPEVIIKMRTQEHLKKNVRGVKIL